LRGHTTPQLTHDTDRPQQPNSGSAQDPSNLYSTMYDILFLPAHHSSPPVQSGSKFRNGSTLKLNWHVM
jgi:hypothetical protein